MAAISVEDFLLKKEQNLVYTIDIREQYERDIVAMEANHMPMAQVLDQKNSLPTDKALVFICKTGQRAEALADMLTAMHGFNNAQFLEGGILGYIQKVDPSLPVY